jgi:zinc transporter, ZIP family
VAEAAFWGFVGASSLLLGAVLGLAFRLPTRVIGLVLGFGAGTLISAVAFELTDEAYRLGGADAVTFGLAAGALTYFAGDRQIARRGAKPRMSPMGEQKETTSSALLLGAVLDGIPESAVIGITLLEGGEIGVAVLLAVFISNLPEALSSSTGMRQAGHPPSRILLTWGLVVAVSAIAAALGYGLLDGASGDAVGLIQAFAGGAVLTMLADTMMPEALNRGGRATGLLVVLGFALAYLLSTLE